MEYVYRTQGTCSTNIELNVEDGVVKEVAFWGGCNGNLQGRRSATATYSFKFLDNLFYLHSLYQT